MRTHILSSNLEDENFVGAEDGLTFGYDDTEEEMLTNLEDPYMMWHIVPVDEKAKTYAFQNRATGTYMGALFNQESGYHGMSLEPVPSSSVSLAPVSLKWYARMRRMTCRNLYMQVVTACSRLE